MSHPTQWTTQYSQVFRDRRQYAPPDARPSDDSWSARTQAYYGPQADLSEHGARVAEIEARTDFGTKNGQASGGVGAAAGQSQPFTATQSADYASANSGVGLGLTNTQPSLSPVRYVHPQKDLWNATVLPHTGVVTPSGDVVFPSYHNATTTRTHFPNGYNNGYATEVQWAVPSATQQQQPPTQEHKPQHHIPGYGGYVRGSQFVHGETFGNTTRKLLSVPTDVPLEP